MLELTVCGVSPFSLNNTYSRAYVTPVRRSMPVSFPKRFSNPKAPKSMLRTKAPWTCESSGSNGWFQFPFLVEWMCLYGWIQTQFSVRKHIIVCVFFLCVFEGMMFFSSGDRGILRKQNAGIIFWSPEAIACWSFRMYRTHAYRDVRVFFCIRICHMFACTYILCKYTLGCSFSH